MKQAVTFNLAVHKATNQAAIVEVGDTVTLLITNDGAAPTTQDVVLTGVSDGGKTIQWDAGTTGNLGTREVRRVHIKHQYNCPGVDDWSVVFTELNAATVAAAVNSLTINGIVYSIDVSEVAIANGLEAGFVTALVDKLNSMVGSNGYWTGVVAGVAGSQTLTLTFNGTSHIPSTWDVAGLTAAAWTNP